MASNTMLILVIGAGGIMFLALLFYGLGGDQSINKRLERVGGGDLPKTKAEKIKVADRITAIRQQNSKTFLDRLASLLPNIENLRTKIARTGQPISLAKYCIWMLISAIIGYLVTHYIFGWQILTSVFATIVIGAGLPYKLVMRMGNKRCRAFIGNFPEAIDTMCRGLRSGLPISESINAVGREMPDPVGEEFRKMSDGMRLGLSMDDAMWDVAKRIDIPEFRFLIIAMAIQRETGGNLAETMGNLSELLRKRRQLKMKIRAMSAEARASAMIIGSLPFIMFLLLLVASKPYAMTLLTTPQGHTLLMAGGFWLSIGIYVMKQMIEFDA